MIRYMLMPAIPGVRSSERPTVVEWVKARGDHFTMMEPILYVEASIGIVEVRAPVTGILYRILATPRMKVQINRPIALYIESTIV